jgi:hypothetical protein
MGQKPPNEASHVTQSEQPATGAGRSKVSHVTGISAEEAKEIVTGAWDDVRAAFRIPDAERQSDEKYTTASGRLFDLIGTVLRDAVSRGEEQATVSYEEAREVVARDVVPPENVLASNYFSKLMGQWKRGESAARGDRVRVDQVDGRHALRVKCGGRDEVVLTLLGPRETDRRQKPNRPAAIRWSIERAGSKLVVQSPEQLAGEPVARMSPGDAAGASESAVTDHSLFSVGVQDAHQAFDRIETSTKSPDVRAHVRQLRKVLRALVRIASVLVIVFGVSYFLSPPLRASVDIFVQATAARIERWWRVRFGPVTIGLREGVPASAQRVYQDSSASWFKGYTELSPLPPPGPATDADQKYRAAFVKDLIRFVDADPGFVMSYQLRWRNGLRVGVLDAGTESKIRLLAVPGERNQFAKLRYVWGVAPLAAKEMTEEFLRRLQGGAPRSGKVDVQSEVFVTGTPELELPLPAAPGDNALFTGLAITLVIIPESLLQNEQREIARDCEVAEIMVMRTEGVVHLWQRHDGWRVEITLP